ncbi:hypothetical protein SBADM41S_09412 [Streptomyces badius]
MLRSLMLVVKMVSGPRAPRSRRTPPARRTARPRQQGPLPWMLSGRSRDALRAQAARLVEYLRDRPQDRPLDVACALATTRSPLDHRAVVTGTDREGAVAPAALTVWPPEGAETLDTDGMYEELAARGSGYGPMFQGLRAAWRSGDEIYAEVGLPENSRATAEDYGLHPAVFDAALHAIGLAATEDQGMALPYAWSGVELFATGASVVRVRVRPARGDAPGRSVALDIADVTGQPVASVTALTLREIAEEQLAAAVRPTTGTAGDALFGIEWTPAALPGRPKR